MFYISSCRNNESSLNWGVTDTVDSIEEFYTFKDLKNFVSQGIKVYGMSSNCGHICVAVKSILIVPNVSDNSLEVYNIKSNTLLSKFSFDTIRNSRNKVWFTGSMSIKLINNTELCISCGACIKFDYEFTGNYVLKIDLKSGVIMSKLDDVMFVCDNANEVHRAIEGTGGDCPNFITSIKANKLLREKGLM